MSIQRLPIPGADDGAWGNILNDFLAVSHNPDGTIASTALTSAGGVTSVNTKLPAGGAITLTALDVGAPTSLSGLSDTNLSGAVNNQVLTFDSTANQWIPASASSVNDATSGAKGIVQLDGDLSGTAASPAVTSTHLIAALPVGQGGTGSVTQNFVDLSSNQTIDGTKTFSSTLAANISGTAATVTTNANLTGDVTSTGNATTVAKINGITLPVSAPVATQVLAATGPTATAWQDPAGYIYDVKANYGGVANGATDDYTHIQNALNAANTAGGGAVYLRAGNWAIGTRLNIPSNVKLFGDGKYSTVITALASVVSTQDANAGYSIIKNQQGAAGNIELSDFSLNCNELVSRSVVQNNSNRVFASMIDFRNLTNVKLSNVIVYAGWFYHIGIYDSTDVLVTNCTTYCTTSGIYNQLDGIHLWGVTRAQVIGCKVDQSNNGTSTDGDDGIVVHVYPGDRICKDIIISNNLVRGGSNGSGIDLANADKGIEGVMISNNLVHDCVNGGIVTAWFTDYTGTTQDVVISGNLIRDCGTGISLGDQSGHSAPYINFMVSGNQVSRSATQQGSDIYQFSSGTNIVVANNNST